MTYFAVLLGLFGFVSISQAQTNDSLAMEINKMAAEDQKWRGIYRLVENGEIDSISIDSALTLFIQADQMHFPILKDILSEYDFPGFDLVGDEACHNFWLLIQHQDYDIEFQKEALKKMKTQVEKNNAALHDYAYLVDRVMLKTDSVQLYGTQMQLNKDKSSFEPKALMQPDNIDSLRKSVNLPPLKVYIQNMNDRNYGSLNK